MKMRNISKEELEEILRKHKIWLREDEYEDEEECADLNDVNLALRKHKSSLEKGERANLDHVNLNGFDLSNANLLGADLCCASLEGANLENADLIEADLSYANLKNANLKGAFLNKASLRHANLENANLSKTNLKRTDLRYADLILANLNSSRAEYADLGCADLRQADLEEADLRRSNLEYADLKYANLGCAYLVNANLEHAELKNANLSQANLMHASLRDANLTGANLKKVLIDIYTIGYVMACPEEGSFIGYKKANDCIVKLLILEDAKRSSATTAKCRCSKAKVLEIREIQTDKLLDSVPSDYDRDFVYKVGEVVSVDNFDDNRWSECSTGIHFFVSRENALSYE